MAKVVLSLDGVVLKEHELTKERTTIGRKPHNDIQIDNLAISGEHAVIVTILNDSFLQDLDSTNGTQVNGRPVKKHFLQENDVVEMAKYKLQFLSSTKPVQTVAEEYQDTLVLRADDDKSAQAGTKIKEPVVEAVRAQAVAEKSQASGDAMPKQNATGFPKPADTQIPAGVRKAGTATGFPGGAGIQFLTGSDAGREIEISKNLTTLGKPGSHLAVIARRKNGYFLTHVEGDAFPSVNGKTLDAKAHALASHDIIELGGVKMEFFVNP